MKHQKRLSAPKHYPIERKNGKYVIAGKGPHKEREGIPMVVFLREVLGYAETADEARNILESRNVKVNGNVVTEPSYTVGFMDSISIDKVEKDYRVLVDKNGLVFKEVEDANIRPHKLVDKKSLKGGHTQLNFDSGVNMVSDKNISTRTTVLFDLDEDEIKEEIPFEEGKTVFVTGGKHIGQIATIKKTQELPGSQPNKVVLDTKDGVEFETVEDYVFVIGDEEPEVAV